MRQREGETASERHQNKIDVGCTEACRFYEIWIVPRSIKSVGGDPHSNWMQDKSNMSVWSIGVFPA